MFSAQLRAPGCPVVIVGTHMDGVNKHDMAHLEEMARKLYINVDHNKTNPYPHVRRYIHVLGTSICIYMYIYTCVSTCTAYVYNHKEVNTYMCMFRNTYIHVPV